MSGGYSYTTLSAEPGSSRCVCRVAFYLDDGAWLRVSGAGTDRPHLGVSLRRRVGDDRPGAWRGHG